MPGNRPSIKVDPYGLYDIQIEANYSRMKRSKELVPALISRYIPLTYLRSMSLYIDPFAKWRVGFYLIKPVSRHRKKRILHALNSRSWFEGRTREYNSVLYPFASPPTNESGGWNWQNTYALGNPHWHWDYMSDTTARTRGIGSPFGEMTRFRILSEVSPPRSHYSVSRGRSYATGYGGLNIESSTTYYRWGVNGSSAFFYEQDIEDLKSMAMSAIDAEIAKSAPQVMLGTLPAFRPFTFGRSILELKDLPRSITTLRDTSRSLHDIYSSMGSIRDVVFSTTSSAKRVPKEYLSYHFGWKQMYEDLVKTLTSTERVAKRFNYLMQRAGKTATHRYSVKYPLPSLTGPGFRYDQIGEYELDRVIETVHTRNIELRGMSSLYFDFPTVALPTLRSSIAKDLLGLKLRPTDIYKIVPWSWLFDWFTSLGNYIDLIDTVNRDRTTINYGFLTATLSGEIRTTYRFRYKSLHEDVIQSWGGGRSTDVFASVNHESSLRYEASKRLGADKLGLPTLRLISTKSNLTTWQTSILSALLASRVK